MFEHYKGKSNKSTKQVKIKLFYHLFTKTYHLFIKTCILYVIHAIIIFIKNPLIYKIIPFIYKKVHKKLNFTTEIFSK